MIQLNKQFKPLQQQTQPIAVNQKAKALPINKNGFESFKNEFVKFQQKLEMDQAAREKMVREQAEQMEAGFVKIMLNTMRNTVNKSGFIDGGQGEKIFTDMLYDQYAENMVKNAAGNKAELEKILHTPQAHESIEQTLITRKVVQRLVEIAKGEQENKADVPQQ